MAKRHILATALALIFALSLFASSGTSSVTEEELSEKTVSTYPVVLPARLWKTSAAAIGDVAYIFGGQDDVGAPVNSILEFTPEDASGTANGSVRALPDVMPSAIHSTAAVVHGSKIYIFGGETTTGKTNAITVYDPNAPEGQRVSSHSNTLPVSWSGMSGASDGQTIYLFGGRGSVLHDTVIRFDPETGSSTISWGFLPTPRTGTSAVYTGMEILVFGGWAGYALDEIVRYDPLRHADMVLPERLPVPVHSTAAVWNGERAIVLGGHTGTEASRGVFVYDPLTAVLETYLVDLDGRREAPSAVWMGDHVDFFGGRSPTEVSSWIMRFTPPTRVPSDTSPFWGPEQIRDSNIDPTVDEWLWDSAWPPYQGELDNETLDRLEQLVNETWAPGPIIFEGPPSDTPLVPEVPGTDPAEPNHDSPSTCGAASRSTQDACHVVFIHGLAGNFWNPWDNNPSVKYNDWITADTAGIDSLKELMLANGYVTVAQLAYYGGECKVTGKILKYPQWASAPHNVHHPTGHINKWHSCDPGGAYNEHGFHTKLNHLGSHMAWWFYDLHRTHRNDVVAHSMGGVILRYSLAQTSLKHSSFPSFLPIEDVVTLGTPHAGLVKACWEGWPVSANQMCPTDGFMKWMKANAQNAGHNTGFGVDWTIISSSCDRLVGNSGHGMKANHKVNFEQVSSCESDWGYDSLSHDDFYRKKWLTAGHFRDTNVLYNDWDKGWGRWSSGSNPPHPGWWIVRGVTTDWG